jgi:hypothetical protein
MTDKKDVWCSLPWTHVCIRVDSKLLPCCRWLDFGADSGTFDQIEKYGISGLNTDYLKQVRKDMLNGIPRKECDKCYHEETLLTKIIKNYQCDNVQTCEIMDQEKNVPKNLIQ